MSSVIGQVKMRLNHVLCLSRSLTFLSHSSPLSPVLSSVTSPVPCRGGRLVSSVTSRRHCCLVASVTSQSLLSSPLSFVLSPVLSSVTSCGSFPLLFNFSSVSTLQHVDIAALLIKLLTSWPLPLSTRRLRKAVHCALLLAQRADLTMKKQEGQTALNLPWYASILC